MSPQGEFLSRATLRKPFHLQTALRRITSHATHSIKMEHVPNPKILPPNFRRVAVPRHLARDSGCGENSFSRLPNDQNSHATGASNKRPVLQEQTLNYRCIPLLNINNIHCNQQRHVIANLHHANLHDANWHPAKSRYLLNMTEPII